MTLQESRDAVEHFKKEYTALRAKHKTLPAIEEFEDEFGVFEHLGRERLYPNNTLRYCRWAMMQAIGGWMGYLHGFLIPNQQSATSMEEYNFLDEKEKRKIVDILNWNMYRSREMNEIQLNEDDEKTAAFLVVVVKEWREHKKVLDAVVKKAKLGWKERCKSQSQ
jgi:hypothetical protein